MTCLVSFITGNLEAQGQEDCNDLLASNDLNERPQEDEREEVTSVELFAESFNVAGSHHEDMYQEALLKCTRHKKKDVLVRAKFEPDNIQDKNAIKFEVYMDSAWLHIGYCGDKKVPKLNKSLANEEVETVCLVFVKRQ